MPRQSRLGLGAKPLTHAEVMKMNKNGDGKNRIQVSQQVNENKFKVGSLVQIIDGTHKNKEAKIINIAK